MSAEQDREPALAQASVPAGAVFLSYASEDGSAAERIASALRAAGIETLINESRPRLRTDHAIAVQVLVETGLERLQRRARSGCDVKSTR